MKRFWFKVRLLLCNLFGKKYTASICGHKTKLVVRVDIFGEKITIVLKKKDLLYCSECLAKMSIQCAWCKNTILVGDPITLYSPIKKDFQVPEHAVIYKKDPLQLVGCLGWDCSSCGLDRAGFWITPGKVERVLSPIEILMDSGAEAIIYNDLSDPLEVIIIK